MEGKEIIYAESNPSITIQTSLHLFFFFTGTPEIHREEL